MMKEGQINSGKRSKSYRLIPVLLNGVKAFIVPAVAILFSYIVIRYSGKDIFGSFVPFLLYFHLANLVSNWGSKDFLIRTFSKEPHKKVSSWQALFLSRSPVLGLVIAVSFLFFDSQLAIYISICILFAYLSNAVQPIVNDQRDCTAVIIIELIAFLVLGSLCLYFGPIELQQLLIIFMTYQAVKSAGYILRYIPFFRFKSLPFQWKLLIVTLPFFLMAVAGFLQAKFDLYIFEAYATEIELANYQIISGFLVYSQALATMILMPYVRNIYRMNQQALVKVKQFMLIAGIPLQLIGSGAIYFVLSSFFDFQASLVQTALFFVIGYPSFTYAVHVFASFAQGKEKQVLVVSLISALVNGVMSLILLSLSEGITGVLISHALAQIVALIGYRRIELNGFVPQENQ